MTRPTVKQTLSLIFHDALHFQGREQLSFLELYAGGIRQEQLDRAVRDGLLKRGVLGYFLPKPCDPGFLSVVDVQNGCHDEDAPYQLAGLTSVDHRHNRGRLDDGRFGR